MFLFGVLSKTLAGCMVVSGFAESSRLEVMIHQIYFFLDEQSENWVCWKRQYCRIEKVFAHNLYNTTVTIKTNIVWNLAVKPPADVVTFFRLVLRWEFRPFHQHLYRRWKEAAQRHINLSFIKFNASNQEDKTKCSKWSILITGSQMCEN